MPKGGTGPGTEHSAEWLVAGLLGELTATLPLVNRSGQVVSRQTLQRGPEPGGRPGPPHFLAGTGCVAESGNWQLRGSEGRSSATNGLAMSRKRREL